MYDTEDSSQGAPPLQSRAMNHAANTTIAGLFTFLEDHYRKITSGYYYHR